MNTSDIFREVCRVFIPELSPQVLAPLVPDHDLQSGEQLRAQRALPVLGARHAGLVDARLVVRLQLAPLHPPLAGGTDDRGDLGVNSIDIMNFGHETGHETGPRSGPITVHVLGH